MLTFFGHVLQSRASRSLHFASPFLSVPTIKRSQDLGTQFVPGTEWCRSGGVEGHKSRVANDKVSAQYGKLHRFNLDLASGKVPPRSASISNADTSLKI